MIPQGAAGGRNPLSLSLSHYPNTSVLQAQESQAVFSSKLRHASEINHDSEHKLYVTYMAYAYHNLSSSIISVCQKL